MIRLPSFFKRKTQADDLELGSVGRRSTKRVAPRSFQRAAEAEELALTEDPEQQRARHRLIGAAVLVLIAVVGLPRILDSRPKTAPNDIAVNIVTSLPIPGTETKADKVEEKPKVDTPVEASKSTTAAPIPEVKVEPKAEAKVEQKPATSQAAPTPSKPSTLGLAAGEEVVAASSAKPKADNSANAVASGGSANGSGKFIIQIGAFASESNVNALVARLKNQKIPSYVLNRTGTDGNKMFLVRAGPYTDKDAAEAAEKKIKAMGLTPRLVETGKQ